MKIKNFGLLKDFIIKNGDEIIDLLNVAEFNELERKKLLTVIELDSMIVFFGKMSNLESSLDSDRIEDLYKKNNELAYELLDFNVLQIVDIITKYDMTEEDYNEIFEIIELNPKEIKILFDQFGLNQKEIIMILDELLKEVKNEN